MQLLGRRVGILVAAWLLTGCPRYSRQPPPYGANPSSESSGATFASNANRADRSIREARPIDGAKRATCLSGTIKTSGTLAIPVARARVKVARSGTVVSETTTDDNGRFSWCAERLIDGMTIRTSVHVEKAAFVTSERQLDIPVGTTTEISIGLNPTQ